MKDVEALEVFPERVGAVGEPAVRERIRRQQVAELIAEGRFRFLDKDGNGGSENEGEEANDHGVAPATGSPEASDPARPEASKPSWDGMISTRVEAP